MKEKLKIYLKKLDVSADWQQIEASLVMRILLIQYQWVVHFLTIEKQALLEAKNLEDRLKVLNSLLDMSINDNRGMENRILMSKNFDESILNFLKYLKLGKTFF